MGNISVRDYIGTPIEKSFSDDLNRLAPISDDQVCAAFEAYDLLKGLRGNEGEIRRWGGKDYQKRGKKWLPVSGNKSQGDAKKMSAIHQKIVEGKTDNQIKRELQDAGHKGDHSKHIATARKERAQIERDLKKEDGVGGSKKQLLAKFEQEFKAAFDKAKGKVDAPGVQKVLDKYMDMDTEAFDSDDLNAIIDKYDKGGESGGKPNNKKDKSHSPDQLTKHAENTSTDQLKKVASDRSKSATVRDAAKRELERRSKDEAEGAKQDADFKHHRMMAGYHSSMEQELWDQKESLESSSDPDVRALAKKFEPLRNKHYAEAEKHSAKARELHNPLRHGSWNDTIPSGEEARRYAKEAMKKKR